MREVLIIHSSQTQTVYTLICGTSSTRHIESTFIELRSMIRQLLGCNVLGNWNKRGSVAFDVQFSLSFEAMKSVLEMSGQLAISS